ncbi:MAG TPA: Na+/H+ antiporter subunit D [Bacillota bacterium]|nr:Na+/H+ antiporter subunit D [Bacillota bacterium]
MNNLVVLPLVIPLIVAIFLVFFRKNIKLQRSVSLLTMLVTTVVSGKLLLNVHAEGILRLDFGQWQPPFGILFVADSFASLLVLTSSIVTLIVLIYATQLIDEKREQMFFYPFVLFLVAGVHASFLTGDLFNLFVSFEVMLLASYVLLTLGGEKNQLRQSIVYMTINILSSWIFLVAIAFLYRMLGTLNLAHLAERIQESGQTPIMTVVSILFLIVFSLKAGLVLYQWLPGSYSAPPTAIAALFGALLTKVGIYAMFRVFTLLFYHEPQITHTLIGWMAAITLIAGSIGAVSSRNIRYIVAYNVIIAVGFIFVGLAIGTQVAFEGALYYLVHDIVVKALLYLLAGTMIYLTGTSRMGSISGLIKNYPILGWLFFITIMSLAGIPPLSGFIGKVLIGQGAIEGHAYSLLFLSFASTLFVLYSLLRIFMDCFWGETIISPEDEQPFKKGLLIPGILLTTLSVALGIGAESVANIVAQAAEVLANPDVYIEAVLYNDS